MTTRIGNVIIICPERPQQCDMCGEIAELRPYGPNGECICFEYGEKNEPVTTKMMNKVLFGGLCNDEDDKSDVDDSDFSPDRMS